MGNCNQPTLPGSDYWHPGNADFSFFPRMQACCTQGLFDIVSQILWSVLAQAKSSWDDAQIRSKISSYTWCAENKSIWKGNKVLVIVNPYGGGGKALKIFKTTVEPMLQKVVAASNTRSPLCIYKGVHALTQFPCTQAGATVVLRKTVRAGHAYMIARFILSAQTNFCHHLIIHFFPFLQGRSRMQCCSVCFGRWNTERVRLCVCACVLSVCA